MDRGFKKQKAAFGARLRAKLFLPFLLLAAALIMGPMRAEASPGQVQSAANGVSRNGWLHVSGTRLVNVKGETVVLHGMSSHGLQWDSDFTTKNAIGATAAYGANLFRVAMYTKEGGYLSRPSAMLKKLYAAVDAAVSRDMYVIIDWHILSDGNPQTNQKEAAAFFKEMAGKYKHHKKVFYEICNEPNGGVTWKQVKAYAGAVI